MVQVIEGFLARSILPGIFAHANLDWGREYNQQVLQRCRNPVTYLCRLPERMPGHGRRRAAQHRDAGAFRAAQRGSPDTRRMNARACPASRLLCRVACAMSWGAIQWARAQGVRARWAAQAFSVEVQKAAQRSKGMQKVLADIAHRYRLDLVYAFGSQADAVMALVTKGTAPTRPIHSDADIGVVFAGGLPPAGRERGITYARLCLELSDLLDPFKVDLVFLQENHSVFQAEAIKGHCLYASSLEVRERYEEMILRRAADFRPFLLAYLKEALEG